MNKFSDISLVSVIILICILAVEIFFMTDDKEYHYQTIQELDINKDGIISRKELKYYLLKIEEQKNKKQIRSNEIKRSVIGGIARGFLMGLILGSFEGGVVLGLILGIINPILLGVEKSLK